MSEVAIKLGEQLQSRYDLLSNEIQTLKSLDIFSERQPQSKKALSPKHSSASLRNSNAFDVDKSSISRMDDNSFEEFDSKQVNLLGATTPVHTRLIRRGMEQQAKLISLREQFEEKSTHSNIPKINDTSRKIVEATRRRSSTTPHDSRRMEVQVMNKPEEVWREFATKEGFLYYYNDETRETCWERPTKGKIIPYIPVLDKRRYSLDHAKSALSGK